MTHSDHPRAVIFDLDGVMVDSEGLHVEAWQVLFDREGIAVADEEHDHGVGMVDADWIRWLFGRRGQQADAVWWSEAKREIYAGILKSNVRPFPGVQELVRRLHGEFRLAIASNSWREDIETVVGALGVADRFRVLVGKQDVERHKPDPQIYLLAASRLGLPPAACTVVEDSVLGIQAAKAAGVRCIAVTNSLPAQRLAEADLVLDSLEDAETVIHFARGA